MSNSHETEGILAYILEKRGIAKKDRQHFLHPDFYRDQHNASLMFGMKKAVKRLQQAVTKKEPLMIFGDYDADGVPATALLVRGLKRLGLSPTPLIPNRADGYGLNPAVVERILTLKPAVLITVDNGTIAKEEIATLQKGGIDVIVVDHHEPQAGERATAALAIINPKQPECPYPFKELCGCALAWKLLDQLYAALKKDRAQLKWDLDLVALSTVADMVPLLDENRLLVIFGLKVLQKTRKPGLQALAEVAGVSLKNVVSADLGYKLAPRINAPSRMHQDSLEGNNAALQLLVTDDPLEANRLAHFLNRHNSERQRLVETHIEQAELQIAEQADGLVLVVHHESWSSGVIGLVASRLMEKYRRPVIALANEGDSIKGSVRTVSGVHALDLLVAADALLERYGGHARAAGLTLNGEVSLFRVTVNSWLEKQGSSLDILSAAASREVDAVLDLEQISLELADALSELEPYGVGFPTPLFSTITTLTDLRLVGNNQQHLSGFLTDGKRKVKMIAFGKAHLKPESEGKYEIRYTLGIDSWREVRSPVCYVQSLYKKD